MMDYLYITIQAEDGKLYQAQKLVSGYMKEETDPGFDIMIYEQLDRHILEATGWVDRWRYSFERETLMMQDFVWPQERYADDGYDRWPGNVVHLLDGPLAGKDIPYDTHIRSGGVLEIPVSSNPVLVWEADQVPEAMDPVSYRQRTLSYNLHNRYGEYFGTLR